MAYDMGQIAGQIEGQTGPHAVPHAGGNTMGPVQPEGCAASISPWVRRCGSGLPAGARVLDLACGRGRHARWFAAQGAEVLAVDQDSEALATLQGVAGITLLQADLEDAACWPLKGRVFDRVVVTRYLHRPHLNAVVELLAPGGHLIYETFMVGHEQFGSPRRPAFLLQPGELLHLAATHQLFVAGFEQGCVAGPAVVQRLWALRPGAAAAMPVIEAV